MARSCDKEFSEIENKIAETVAERSLINGHVPEDKLHALRRYMRETLSQKFGGSVCESLNDEEKSRLQGLKKQVDEVLSEGFLVLAVSRIEKLEHMDEACDSGRIEAISLNARSLIDSAYSDPFAPEAVDRSEQDQTRRNHLLDRLDLATRALAQTQVRRVWGDLLSAAYDFPSWEGRTQEERTALLNEINSLRDLFGKANMNFKDPSVQPAYRAAVQNLEHSLMPV